MNKNEKLRSERVFALGLMALAALSLGACQPRSSEEPRAVATPLPAALPPGETAQVRVIHAIPGGAPADVYADDDKVFSALAYKAVTPYEQVADNEVTFKLKNAGQPGEPVAENHERLADGSRYTLVVLPGERGQAAELKVLTDERELPQDGKTRLRVVNAAADAGELEVMLRGREDPLVGGLDAADDAGYREVAPVDGTLVVRDKDKKRIVAESPNAALAAGKTYTMVILGRVAGTPPAEVLVVEDGRAGASPRDPIAPPS